MTKDKDTLTAMPVTNPIRVLIVDDHAIMRAGLRLLIENKPGLKVVGEAGNQVDALALAGREQPDIVLLDIDLGNSSSLDFLPELLAAVEHSHVLILTGVLDSETHDQAMRLGAMGVVLKEKAPEVLVKAIQKVHAGEVWLDHSAISRVFSEMSRNGRALKADPETIKVATLTAREREVVTLIGEGLKNRQIAERLFISETTVRHHLTSIFSKLGVSDRLELIIYAYRQGIAKLLM